MFTKKPELNKKNKLVVSVSVVGDVEIQKLNKKYLKRDYPTDVLSFNIDEEHEGDYFLGDIVVNKDQAQRQAGKYGNSVEEEVSELVGHGMLHLLGVHHDGDE